jgi:hypothetical protein
MFSFLEKSVIHGEEGESSDGKFIDLCLIVLQGGKGS